MRLGIDGKCLLPPRAGIARYLEGLLAGLGELAPEGLEVDVVRPQRQRRTLPWVLWEMQRRTGRGYNVFHFPFYYPPMAPACPVTVAIHDVLPLLHPEWFPRAWVSPLRWLVPRGARRAAAVLTGSLCVGRAIVELCRVPQERIRLMSYGVDGKFAAPSAEETASTCARLGLTGPYLLQVGALEWRRGVDISLAAVAQVRDRHSGLELALVGEQRGEVPALTSAPAWLRRLGRVRDEDLPALYSGSELVLAPSRGEGFDLPVLEALACGAAVVASDIDVHVEHFGHVVALFESGRPEALADAIEGVLEDSKRRAQLRADGPKHAAMFSWRESARRHVDFWREVAAP